MEIDDYLKKFDKISNAKMQNKIDASALFDAFLLEWFTKYPAIKSVEFPCYAPDFSDGDACIYSARIYDMLMTLSLDDTKVRYYSHGNALQDDNWNDIEHLPSWGISIKQLQEAQSAFIDIAERMDMEYWEDETHYENVSIVISRDGITTEEYYNHD